MTGGRWASALLLALVLLGFGLRLLPWAGNRFLEDEALYAYWGLQIATGADPMLDSEPVDKPPLFPYILATTFLLTGATGGGLASETAARIPGLLASTCSIALVYALGQVLYRDRRIALLAAGLLALSPFDLLFASTAFTDPLLTALVLGALLAAARGRLGLAGVWAGLAVATKQQALLFLPLMLAVAAIVPGSASPSTPDGCLARARSSGWPAFVLSLSLLLAGVVWWDAARVQRPGFLAQSLISYGGLGPAAPRSLLLRAAGWLELLGSFWASPWFNALWIGATVTWLARSFRGTKHRLHPIDRSLALFVGAFVLLHLLVGFQLWDRYLLPVIPLCAVLAARAFVHIGEDLPRASWRRAYAIALPLILAAVTVAPVVRATRNQLPLGGDHGAYDGIEQLAAFLKAEAPPDSVLYHYWLGYHYRFYLYGAPLRLHWYPDPADLVRDATIYRREPRFVAFPSFRDGSTARLALEAAGIRLLLLHQTHRRDGSVSFRLYRLEGPW